MALRRRTFDFCARALTRVPHRCYSVHENIILDTNDSESCRDLRIFSGIQPTGEPHLGNYLGAIKNWVNLQDKYENVIFSVVDLHAITLPQDPSSLRSNTLTMFASLIACGLDPDRSILFRQSDVPFHTELCWILSNHCTVNKLQGMTHWREKSKTQEMAGVGLLTYPILQAADILLYKSTGVPVGKDQQQHLYLTRDLAYSFNAKYGTFFPLPKIIISHSPNIRNLQIPEKKMSKSDISEKSRINLTDTPDEILRKIKKSVSDSLGKITYDPEERVGVANLIDIHAGMTNRTAEDISSEYKDLTVGKYKLEVADAIITTLKPMQEEYHRLLSDKSHLLQLLVKGSEKASDIASKNLKEVKNLIGIS